MSDEDLAKTIRKVSRDYVREVVAAISREDDYLFSGDRISALERNGEDGRNQAAKVGSIWRFFYSDWDGIYVCTNADERYADFEAVEVSEGSDPYISIGVEDPCRHGTCLWIPRAEWEYFKKALAGENGG